LNTNIKGKTQYCLFGFWLVSFLFLFLIIFYVYDIGFRTLAQTERHEIIVWRVKFYSSLNKKISGAFDLDFLIVYTIMIIILCFSFNICIQYNLIISVCFTSWKFVHIRNWVFSVFYFLICRTLIKNIHLTPVYV
jgi:hypothetical protein